MALKGEVLLSPRRCLRSHGDNAAALLNPPGLAPVFSRFLLSGLCFKMSSWAVFVVDSFRCLRVEERGEHFSSEGRLLATYVPFLALRQSGTRPSPKPSVEEGDRRPSR